MQLFSKIRNLLGGSSLDGPFYLEQAKNWAAGGFARAASSVIYTTAGYPFALLPQAQIRPPVVTQL
jgi:hypothetical protein